jgi:hypothetical protein
MPTRTDLFLENAVKSLGGLNPKEFWPLNPGQLTSYFDGDLLLDYYKKIKTHREEGKTAEELSEKIRNSHLIYDFLINYACIGFKVLHNFDITKIDFRDREDFFDFLLEIAEYKEKKTTAEILGEFENLKEHSIEISENSRGVINKFKTALFGLNWSYFYDNFAVCGNDSKRPIEFGSEKEHFLVLDEYYNQKPIEVWPLAEENFFEGIKIYNIYEKFEYEHNIFGRLKMEESLGEKIKRAIISIDNLPQTDLGLLAERTERIFDLTMKQSEYVNALTDMEKVEKAILMNYHAHREILGEEWRELFDKTRKNLEIFGDKFIKELAEEHYNNPDENLKRFDPRNNWY